jgi:branched-chain amino acid transport system permease protein
VFLTHYNAGIGPGEAGIMKSVRYVAFVAVGGMGSLWGTVATSAVLTFLSLRGYFGTLDDAVFGAVLVGVMLFSPEGILRLDARAALAAAFGRLRGSEGAP